ncbi:hypothetical protein glysoja_003465 [Glycine soja]|nr:hypothetical protein glysoja_003465 [Glycine soja]
MPYFIGCCKGCYQLCQFWRQMEPFFGLISEEDIAYWKQKINLESSGLMPMEVPSYIDDCEAVANGFGLTGSERDFEPGDQMGAAIVAEQLQLAKGDSNGIPLGQRLISALISEECSSESEDIMFDACDTESEADGDLDHHSPSNSHLACHSPYNGYRITRKSGHDETESDIVDIPSTSLNSSQNMPTLICLELQYATLGMNEKLLLELQSIRISPESVIKISMHLLFLLLFFKPEILQTDDEGICEDITWLEEHCQGQISNRKCLLDGLLKSASVTKELQEKDFEQNALDKLVMMAYEKYMDSIYRVEPWSINLIIQVLEFIIHIIVCDLDFLIRLGWDVERKPCWQSLIRKFQPGRSNSSEGTRRRGYGCFNVEEIQWNNNEEARVQEEARGAACARLGLEEGRFNKGSVPKEKLS